ncbi:MAG: hypothetical protein LUC43_06615 [Burkholderiales bacterium]|nr:hypothetical protein [Burkholderiales bacterium]
MQEKVKSLEESKFSIQPIKFLIKYEGLKQGEHLIDLGTFGESLEGFAKILGTVGQFIATGEYVKQATYRDVKVVTDAKLKKGRIEIATWVYIGTSIFAGVGATVIGALVKHILSKGDREEVEHLARALAQSQEQNQALAKELIEQSKEQNQELAKSLKDIVARTLEQSAQQSKEQSQLFFQLMETLNRLTEGLTNAAKQAVAPIGKSCESITVFDEGKSLVKADLHLKDYLAKKSQPLISDLASFDIKIIGLNLDSGECVISSFPYERVSGKIIDPSFSFSLE